MAKKRRCVRNKIFLLGPTVWKNNVSTYIPGTPTKTRNENFKLMWDGNKHSYCSLSRMMVSKDMREVLVMWQIQILAKFHNKNTFQWDAYYPACTARRGVYPSMHWATGCTCLGVSGQGVYLPEGCLPESVPQVKVSARRVYPSMQWGRPPPTCWQTDTCENITFANFVCGR